MRKLELINESYVNWMIDEVMNTASFRMSRVRGAS